MTPSALAWLRCEELDEGKEYHITTKGGHLYSGRIVKQYGEVVILEIANLGPVGYTGDLGTHRVWLAIEDISAIEERS